MRTLSHVGHRLRSTYKNQENDINPLRFLCKDKNKTIQVTYRVHWQANARSCLDGEGESCHPHAAGRASEKGGDAGTMFAYAGVGHSPAGFETSPVPVLAPSPRLLVPVPAPCRSRFALRAQALTRTRRCSMSARAAQLHPTPGGAGTPGCCCFRCCWPLAEDAEAAPWMRCALWR